MDRPPEFTIVEAGAESGDFASDLLNRLYQVWPTVPWNYVITEPSQAKQRQQRERLTRRSDEGELIPSGAVRWVNNLNELAPIIGIVLASELLDAIPVRLVDFSEDRWREVRVVVENDTFKFILEPIKDPRLAAMIDKIPGPVAQPYRTEINLGALDWFSGAAGSLRRGFVLLVDYGFSRTDYYSPLRTEGTLTAYRNQRRQKDIFEGIGETDITAHVDFTAIAEAGLMAGCQLLGFTDQHHFMVGAGERRMRSFEGGDGHEEREQFLRTYKTLMHPEMMGLAFKYLLMGKDVPATAVPSGFRYASDADLALGL
jgi:SAM-dependent MidA family methyltransferase